MSASLPTRPRVFLDVQSGSEFLGRITIELFSDKTPKTAENFRAICTPPSSAQPLTYKGSRFHRIIDEFMIQGGDITASNGTGGMSIYGPVFEDENIGWREIDAVGLVCMANRGKGTNNSQFFITLAPCQHLNTKHTVFGHVIKGLDVCERMAKVQVDNGDRPLSEPLHFQVKRETWNVLKQEKREITQPNDTVQQADPWDRRINLDLYPDTAGTLSDLYHPAEEATPGLMKPVVATPLLDQCLHMTIHRDLHDWIVVTADHGGNGYVSRQHPPNEHRYGRLDNDRLSGGDDYGDGDKEDNGVKFKGRGSMKYQEPKAW
ncbi:MAG: hypothetical protein Q9226_004558 [Calogaya cf. arnoldii]